MARMVTHRMGKALRDGAPVALFAEIDHPRELKRFWTGCGTKTYNGHDWQAVGKLGAVGPVQFSSELAIQEISFVLAGVPPDVEEWLGYDVRNRAAAASLACLAPTGRVIADPLQIVDAVLDFQKLKTSDSGTSAIILTARAGFYTLERALDEVHSSEEQRARYPDDSGNDLITQLQQQQPIWTPT
jgi:hypothetical protein